MSAKEKEICGRNFVLTSVRIHNNKYHNMVTLTCTSYYMHSSSALRLHLVINPLRHISPKKTTHHMINTDHEKYDL